MKSRYVEMGVEELLNEENEIRTALFNLRVKNTTKELEDTDKLRQTRRELARVLTALSKSRRKATAEGSAKA